MSLRADRLGLESLPLKLMIVTIVASMSIVPSAEALNNLRDRDFIQRVELQLDCIVSTAQLLAIGGPGGVRTVKLDFASEGSLAFERMEIGDDKGEPNMSSAVLRFTNGAVMVKTCSDPPVWMRSKEGCELVIESSHLSLRMSAQIEGRAEFILVEAV